MKAAFPMFGLLVLTSALWACAQTRYTPTGEPQRKESPKGEAPNEARPADEEGNAYVVYDERTLDYHFAGVMPDGQGVSQDPKFAEGPHSGKVCYRARYQLDRHPWVAVAALLDGVFEPKRDFDMFKALGAKKGDRIVVRFMARSPVNSVAQFKVGGVAGDSVEFPIESDWIQLGPDWKQIEIDVTDKRDRPADLSKLRAALTWAMDREHNARGDNKVAEVQLDRVYYTKLKQR